MQRNAEDQRKLLMARRITKTMMQTIADRLAIGETLVQICKDPDMPAYRTITTAVNRDEELYEIYRRGRVMQAEYYSDHIVDLATEELPPSLDAKVLNAEMQRRKLEIETLKWTFARNQPFGIRDKKEEAVQQGNITISWEGQVHAG